MIKHIVMFNFKEEAEGLSKKEICEEIKKDIDALGSKISEIKKIEAGINFSTRDTAYDLVLYSEFESEADLDAYQIHPDHVALKDKLSRFMTSLGVGDYHC